MQKKRRREEDAAAEYELEVARELNRQEGEELKVELIELIQVADKTHIRKNSIGVLQHGSDREDSDSPLNVRVASPDQSPTLPPDRKRGSVKKSPKPRKNRSNDKKKKKADKKSDEGPDADKDKNRKSSLKRKK